MALIKCPECGKEVSSKAKVCPNCGCPVEEMGVGGTVRIKMPNIELGLVGLFSSRDATITDEEGNVLWCGQHGENASFSIEEETDIIIDLGHWANDTYGTVKPNKKYAMVQDLGAHMYATYRLSEVDVIDSE